MNAPDQPLESVSLMPASDEQLLRGSVPGPDSWLRAWRMVQSPTSFSKAEKHSHTESYISIRQGQCSRHMYKQMLQCMAEVVRRKKRSVIKSARHISVALDDKAPFRILRFRAVSASESETPVYTGILGCITHHGEASKSQLENFDEDYGIKVAESVKTAIEKLASDPTGTDGDAVDQELVQHFLSNVISCSTDGASAMRKSMSVMRVTTLPNLRVMVIDRAHNIRRAGLPLTLESRFGEFWKHFETVVPSLQNSEQWKLRFRTLQSANGNSESVKRAISTLSFAKQRFDSTAKPQSQYVCMLEPIALLLAYQTSDMRIDAKIRVMSQQMLEAMTAEHVLTAGLCADFGYELLKFTRQCDMRDHDISQCQSEKNEFILRMTKLFLEGCVLAEPEIESEATWSFLAVKNAMAAGAISYGGKLHHMWGPLSKEQCLKVMESAHVAADTCIARVRADNHPGDPDMAFSVFDLTLWTTKDDEQCESLKVRLRMLQISCICTPGYFINCLI